MLSFWGSAPDPDGGAYSAPPYPPCWAGGGLTPSRTLPLRVLPLNYLFICRTNVLYLPTPMCNTAKLQIGVARAHTYTHKYPPIHTYAMYLFTHIHIHKYTHVHTDTQMYATNVHMDRCSTHTHTHTHTHIHTHKHTHNNRMVWLTHDM